MRTVLLGTDFMYDKDGNLKPIEINTSVGWNGPEKVEDDDDCLDLSSLDVFVKSNNFDTISYIGDIPYLSEKLETYCNDNSITYEFYPVGHASISIPYVEDSETKLIIRSAYDTTAIVDDTYCRDKVNFLNLIKNSTFNSQFAYVDDNNTLISNITSINDNGNHPNFILKARYPQYDKEIYPKFYKVTNQEELNVILQNVSSDYFLMENYCNINEIYNNHIKVVRSLNILYPPSLESIQIGQYTNLNQNILVENITYDSNTFELDSSFRETYTTYANTIWSPKLLDSDLVEMSDGTYKTALDLEVNDIIKTIDIPNPNGVDNSYYLVNFGITYETLLSGTTYSTNKVIGKKRVNRITYVNELTFNDNSTWMDTSGSSYLIERDNVILFERIDNLVAGDIVILIDTTNENVNFIKKTITDNLITRTVFSGWVISVENAHMFLTKTSSTNNQSFVAIEHNSVPCSQGRGGCLAGCGSTFPQATCAQCPKTNAYCCEGQCSAAA